MTPLRTALRRLSLAALFTMACATAAVTPLSAQTVGARLDGTVRIRGTNAPLPDATVAVEGTDLVGRTDSLGRYMLLRVPAGPQVLMVR